MPDTSPTPVDPHDYFERRKDDVGTHSDVCWKHHPDCAYWLGRASIGPDSERIRELEAENERLWHRLAANAVTIGRYRRKEMVDYGVMESNPDPAAGLLPDEPVMIAKLREAGYMVIRPKFPPEPRKIDDPAVLARRIGLRVAGPDEIVVNREDVATLVSGAPGRASDHLQAAANLRGALSQPPPFNPDVTLIRNLEGNQREMRGYQRDAEEQAEETP